MLIMLPIKPLSNNQMTRTFKGRVIKSKAYRDLEKQVASELSHYHDRIEKFKKAWLLVESCLEVHYTVYSPNYYKKNKTMNLSGGDVANYEKCLTDSIFKVLKINDAYIQMITLQKIPSDKWMIASEFKITHHPEMGSISGFSRQAD